MEELIEEEYRKFAESVFGYRPSKPNFYDNYQFRARDGPSVSPTAPSAAKRPLWMYATHTIQEEGPLVMRWTDQWSGYSQDSLRKHLRQLTRLRGDNEIATYHHQHLALQKISKHFHG